MSKYAKEIEKRRTFAIISHPDAGKTTLTEKFLLYGGAICQRESDRKTCSIRLDGDREGERYFRNLLCASVPL